MILFAAIVAATVVVLALIAAWLIHRGDLTVTARKRPLPRIRLPKGDQS